MATSDGNWSDHDFIRGQTAETVEHDDTQQWPLMDDDGAEGRREMESESSDYQPSDSEEPSPSPEAAEPADIDDPEEPEIKDEEEDGSVRMGNVTAYEVINGNGNTSEDGTSLSIYRSGLKRTRERTFSTPLADDNKPPAKKQARKPFNKHYMDLLQDDTDDARRKYISEDWPELSETQIGLTVWTAEEKEMFFESVGRLGRDDIAGIAARLQGSKSEVEVRHYMHVLKAGAQEKKRDIKRPLHRPLLSDFPAAAEISEACCDALQKTADAVALHEKNQESKEGQQSWGRHWLLTGDNCHGLSKAALEMAGMPTTATNDDDDDDASNQSPVPTANGGPRAERLAELCKQLNPRAVPMLALLNVRTMLLLSERVFMNGIEEDANYMGLGDELPSIDMSAVQDLYSLVYAITQRLVATAMHICRSRDQARSKISSGGKKLVRPRDVRTAVASLGLKKDSQVFWARCPRRLGLSVRRSAVPFADMDGMGAQAEVVEDEVSEDDSEDNLDDDSDESTSEDSSEEDSSSSSDDDSDIISTYGEVERELLPEGSEYATNQQPSSHNIGGDEDSTYSSEEEDDESDDDDDESDEGSSDSSDDSDDSQDSSRGQDDEQTVITEQRINNEADEIIHYTATGYPTATWSQNSLKNRIRDELKEEEYACAVDEHASRQEELYLWAVLGQPPPPELGLDRLDQDATPHVEGFSTDTRRFPVDEIIETGSNWRDKLKYDAEWEKAAVQAQEAAREANKETKDM